MSLREVVMRGDRSGLDAFLREAARIIAENSGATPLEAIALVLAHESAAHALYLKGKSPRAIAAGIAKIVERAEAAKRIAPTPGPRRVTFESCEDDEEDPDESDGDDGATEDE